MKWGKGMKYENLNGWLGKTAKGSHKSIVLWEWGGYLSGAAGGNDKYANAVAHGGNDFCHAVPLPLHTFHWELLKLPVGCSHLWCYLCCVEYVNVVQVLYTQWSLNICVFLLMDNTYETFKLLLLTLLCTRFWEVKTWWGEAILTASYLLPRRSSVTTLLGFAGARPWEKSSKNNSMRTITENASRDALENTASAASGSLALVTLRH